jgi:cytochrome oxidase Cu insertion factor (SCO1/SenC/PrrC family)
LVNYQNKSDIKLPITWDEERNLELNKYLEVFEDFIKLLFIDETNLEAITKQFFIAIDSA